MQNNLAQPLGRTENEGSHPALGAKPTSWWHEARALYRKDIKAELRTKVAISSVGLFTFSSLMLIALATAGLKDVEVINPITHLHSSAWDSASRMGMLWVLLCFAAFAGLSHSFVHEEEAGTTTALRLSMSPEAVYVGKLLFNLTLVLSVTLVVTPVYMLLTGMPFYEPVKFLTLMFGGCLGLSAAATIVAALAAKAHGTGALYGAIGLPMLVVFLTLLMNAATSLYKIGLPLSSTIRDLGGLLSYAILLITLSAITFRFVWED